LLGTFGKHTSLAERVLGVPSGFAPGPKAFLVGVLAANRLLKSFDYDAGLPCGWDNVPAGTSSNFAFCWGNSNTFSFAS
jgi:hypothetical protein